MPSFAPGVFLTSLTCAFLSVPFPLADLGIEPNVQEGPSITIPSGQPITLDGVLDPDEWGSAVLHSFNGGEVLLQHSGDVVSVGVRGSQAGFPHLAISVGDSAWVLHASAALGKIVYAADDEGWALVTPPNWELRDPSLTTAALEAREDYLNTNGWVGTTGRMGQIGETEFLIRLDRFGHKEVRFAVAHLAPDSPEQTTRWPETNRDDMGDLQLLTGPMPDRLELAPTQWALLLVSKGDSVPSHPGG